MWNFDGSSTEQAAGEDSEIYIMPRAVFNDPFRGGENVMVLSECFTPEMKPAIGNTRAAAKEVMDKYADMDPWFGIEQEYTLMCGCDQKVGIASDVPLGFNKDGSEPAKQGPYYCGAGTNVSIGRKVAEEHYAKCLYAGIKVAGINAEVMPGQWEYQVGPCKGMEMGDHLVMSRYIMLRVTEDLGVQVTFHPKPRHGDWNGAGCHTNFSTKEMREEGGLDVIYKVCEAFGAVSEKHVEVYGTDNDQRLTGKHETCSINEFKFGVADRGASIRIPRETWAKKKGYLEDRRPAANCDPYKVTARMMQTTGDCITGKGLDM
jgi:glutamine synthetase